MSELTPLVGAGGTAEGIEVVYAEKEERDV
jgi:hypothetical protein